MARKKKKPYPEFSVFLTFFVLIAFGTAMLAMPFVRYQGGISFLDKLFMATSAVCVTGLVTVPTSGFNLAGQSVLLMLMQLGGIGIMTITSSLILVFRGELNLHQRLMAASITESYALREVEGVLVTVLKYTFITEALGGAVLAVGFGFQGYNLADSLYYGLFHAVSAFCNAGFSPFDTSLIGMNGLVKVTVMALIVLGGLGYYVVFDVGDLLRRRRRLTIHTRAVIYGTAVLIIGGAFLLYLFERGGISLLDAFFQSVTARTAGFNTVDIAGLHASSLFVLIILMIIGAAPGSTGGGVKLTTFLVTLFSAYNIILGRDRVVIFGRKLPFSTVLRAYALIMLYVAFLALGTIVLLHTEGKHFIDVLFEMTSAEGTVGLSLGLTPLLSWAGKVAIIIAMFVGRLGPAVLVLTFLREEHKSRIDYPEEKIILG
ncbi:MAG: potassium transporter TrkG [Deltaproteobacteria bacterium]|jgi:trk system potassium uptake protein TrkH